MVMHVSFGPELISALVREFNANRLPARIYKIETGDVWAAFRISGRTEWLLFSWHTRHYGLGIVDEETVSGLKKMKAPKSSFGEALKRNFLNGTFLSAEQLNADRLFLFRSERIVGAGFSVANILLFEGMERNSNLLILDENHVILDAAKHIHPDVNRYRTVLPGNSYTAPPPLGGKPWEEHSAIDSPVDVQNLAGIGKPLAKAIAQDWEIAPPAFWKQAIGKLLRGSPDSMELHFQKIGAYLTLFPVLFTGSEALNGNIERRCGEATAGGIQSLYREKGLSSVKKALEKEIRSRRRHIDGLAKQIALADRAEEFKKYGDLLLSSSGTAVASDQYEAEDWETGRKILIPLDSRFSLAANAAVYFKKYKKGKVDVQALQRKIASIDDGIAELNEQMDALDSIDDPRLLAATAQDILEWIAPRKSREVKKKKKKEDLPPHIRISCEGDEIFVGLNARGNRYVTFKAASPGDLWFHVHEAPGAHVILKVPGEKYEVPEESILMAASLAAWFSKLRHSAKVQVDYTKKKNVRSIPGSAIAHVTYTQPETVQVRPDLWKEYPEARRSIHLAADR